MQVKLKQGEDYYINNDGLYVFTAAYHLRRGFCCGNGCVHCPYDYQRVPEPKRTQLLKARLVDDSDTKGK